MYVLNASLVSSDIPLDQANVVRVVDYGKVQHGCRVVKVRSEFLK